MENNDLTVTIKVAEATNHLVVVNDSATTVLLLMLLLPLILTGNIIIVMSIWHMVSFTSPATYNCQWNQVIPDCISVRSTLLG